MAEAPVNLDEVSEESNNSLEQTDKTLDSTNQGTADEEPVQTIEEIDYHPDCPVCLQSCYYPVKLPCGHIFCFLCIKGVALRSRKCALCRHSLGTDYLENPTLIRVVDKACIGGGGVKSSEGNLSVDPCSQEYVWYYEGRNGWWLYDEKTSSEVEKAFKGGKRSCTLLIAGFLYVIDFENMFQTRKNEPGRRRRIKRDKRDVESKGIAGIRIPASASLYLNAPTQTKDSNVTESTGDSQNQKANGESSVEEHAQISSDVTTISNTESQISAEPSHPGEKEEESEIAQLSSSLGNASL